MISERATAFPLYAIEQLLLLYAVSAGVNATTEIYVTNFFFNQIFTQCQSQTHAQTTETACGRDINDAHE